MGCLLQTLLYLALLPISLIVATPFVLVAAVFGSGPYWNNVRESYGKLTDFWFEASSHWPSDVDLD